MSKRSATQQREEQPDVEPEGGQVGRLGGRDETEGVPDSIEKRQSKLASAMARILGDVAENKAEQQKQEGNESAKKAKRSRKVDEKPILSKHKNIEAQIDDQKLEDKAKKQISRERKLKALDVARVKPDDFVFANDLEKKLKKIATKGVVKLFNAIRVAQKTVDSAKGSSATKSSSKISAMSQSGFMSMIKEPSTSNMEAPETSLDALNSSSKSSLKSSKVASKSKEGGGSVPWIDDGFMMKDTSTTTPTAKAWDMDSD